MKNVRGAMRISLVLLSSMAVVAFLAAPGHSAYRGPLLVYILAGQSNMEGQGGVLKSNPAGNNGINSLEYFTTNAATKDSFGYLLADPAQIKWKVLNDVWIAYKRLNTTAYKSGGLTAGYGAGDWAMGMELGFGYAMGDYLDNQVLLIKTCWGGKSLMVDFRPPSSGGTVGPSYTMMVQQVQEVLNNIKTYFPSYDGNGYRISGFVWHQGWNDMYNTAAEAQYAQNLINLIKDLRAEWKLPKLPMMIVEEGHCGPKAMCDPNTFEPGLMRMRHYDSVAVKAFTDGTVKLVISHDFYYSYALSPTSTYYHWNNNAKSYYQMGLASADSAKTFLPASDLTDSGTATAQYADSPAGSEKEKAFDNNSYTTKYVVPHASAWLQYQFRSSRRYAVNRYTIASANTSPESDPASWKLMGSNDGTTWVTVDSQSNVTFQYRWQKNEYTVANVSGYSSYRIAMTNHSGANLQVAEIQMFGSQVTVPVAFDNRGKPAGFTALRIATSSNGTLSITLGRESGQDLRFNVYTTLGQKIYSARLKCGITTAMPGRLPRGIYISEVGLGTMRVMNTFTVK